MFARHFSTHASRRWTRIALAMGILGALLVPLLQAAPAQAKAAGEVTITRSSAASVLTGQPNLFDLSVTCSAVDDPQCDALTVTIPLTSVANMPSWRYELAANPSGATGAVVGSNYVITFPSSVPAGATVALSLGVTPPNFTTPNNTTVTLTPALGGSNVDASSAAVPATAMWTATFAPAVRKTTYSSSVLADSTFRWYIDACQSDASYGFGVVGVTSGTLTDTLPAGATVIAVSDGGTVAAGVVTWPVLPAKVSSGCGQTNGQFWVDVQLPAASYPLNSTATNSTTFTASGVGGAGPLSTTKTNTVTVVATVSPTGIFAKESGATDAVMVGGENFPATYPGKWAPNNLNFSLNNSSGQVTFGKSAGYVLYAKQPAVGLHPTIRDGMPCLSNNYQSYTDGTICADPAFITEGIELSLGSFGGWDDGQADESVYSDGWGPEIVTNTGRVVDVSPPGGSLYNYFPIPELLAGESVAEVRLPYNQHYFSQATSTTPKWIMKIAGHLAENAEEGKLVENTSQMTLDSAPGTSTVAGLTPPAGVVVLGDVALLSVYKDQSLPASNTAGTINISGSFSSHTDITEPVVVSDLLPAGVTASGLRAWSNPGDRFGNPAVIPTAETRVVTSLVAFETIDNYNGTGRTLVRASFPPAAFTAPRMSAFYVEIKAPNLNSFVQAPPSVTNVTRAFLTNKDVISCNAYAVGGGIGIGSGTPPLTSDSDDWGGPSIAADNDYCEGSVTTPITRVGAAQSLTKQVKGDLDANYQAYPAIASSSENAGSASFKVSWKNTGPASQPLKDVVVYDLLPKVGDTGVSQLVSGFPRNSQFPARFASMDALPAGVTAQYSAAANPCRPEVMATNAGCDPTWVSDPATLAGGLASVTGIKFVAAGPFASGAGFDASFTLTTPDGIGGQVAYNSAAASAKKVGDSLSVTTVEPPKVGLSAVRTDVELSKALVSAAAGTVSVGSVSTWAITVKHGTVVSVDGAGQNVYTPAGIVGTARGVVVADLLPAGVAVAGVTLRLPGSSSYVAQYGNDVFDRTTGVWKVGDVAPGDTYVLRLSVRQLVPVDQRVNFAQVTAVAPNSPPDVDSTPGNCTIEAPSEDDCAVATAGSVVQSSLALKKQVETAPGSGEYVDADTADVAPSYKSGSPVKYRFIVTNTGPGGINDVTVTDPLIGSACDLEPFDLAIGASTTLDCTWPTGFAAGTVTNTASVTGTDETGALLPEVTDPAVITVLPPPGIKVIKEVNGTAADTPGDASETAIGGTAVITYTVSNPLDVPVLVTSLVDPSEPALLLNDELCERSDGLTLADPLPKGVTIVCTIESPVTGDEVYGGTVRVDGVGTGLYEGAPVFDTNPGYYLGVPPHPEISLVITVNGQHVGAETDAPKVAVGSIVTLEYTVTNTGNEPLSDVAVTDPRFPDLVCPKTELAIGESMVCTIQVSAEAALVGGGATATGVGVISNETVDDPDVYWYVAGQAAVVALEEKKAAKLSNTGLRIGGSIALLSGLLAAGALALLTSRKRRRLASE